MAEELIAEDATPTTNGGQASALTGRGADSKDGPDGWALYSS